MIRYMISAMTIAAAAAGAWGQEKVTFQVKHVPGSYVTSVATQTVQQVGNDRAAAQTATMTVVQEITIDKPTDQGQHVRVVHRRIQQSHKGGPVEMTYDSADKPLPNEKNPLAVIGLVVDVPIDVTLDKAGKVTEVKGLDQVWEKVAVESPLLARQMKATFSEMVKEQFAQSSRVLPDKPVGLGDTWEVLEKQTMIAGVPIDFRGTYKLRRFEMLGGRRVAVVEKSGVTKVAPSASKPAKPDGEIKEQGTLKINVATGQVEESDLTQEMTITKTLSGKETTVKTQTRTVQSTKEGKYRK